MVNEAFNMDCLEAMRKMPDKYYDLAVVDPPYGAGERGTYDSTDLQGGCANYEKSKFGRFGSTTGALGKYNEGIIKSRAEFADDSVQHWDIAPPVEYFNELARVSKNQIIWGGNYFDLPPTRCFLILRKSQVPLEGMCFAPVEYAWTSFNHNAEMYEVRTSAISSRFAEARFHPTQKPVELYAWIYRLFAKEGDKILDTHLGSGSSRIAAYDMGLDFTGYEISKYYFDEQEKRFQRHTSQLSFLREEDVE